MSCHCAERWLGLLLLVGCGSDEPIRERDLVPPDPPVTTPLDPCGVPLSAVADDPAVRALSGTRVRASGGSGVVTFRLDDNPSGGLISPTTGDYVAGATGGVTDRVVVSDEACAGSVEVVIDVLPPFGALPETALVPPFTTFTIDPTGGSGEAECATLANRTGGTLQGCTWTAGPTSATDDIEVRDLRSGEQVVVHYTVDPSATLRLWGRTLYLPQGHPFQPTWTAGTQVVELTHAAGLETGGGTITGLAPGSYLVEAVDHYVPDLSTSFMVEVVAPRTFDARRDGEYAQWGHVVGGDLNQDGFDDVVVSAMDLSL